MATATTEPMKQFAADPLMLKAVIDGVDSCFAMCDAKAHCVGISTVPTNDPGIVTGLIGVHGEVSGFLTVNMAEKVAMSAVGGLLQDKFKSLDHQVIDGVGEITNILAGGIKNGLSGTKWGFKYVTVPSVIVGQNYQIAYAKGLQFLATTFEQDDSESVMIVDRLIKVTISLIRL